MNNDETEQRKYPRQAFTLVAAGRDERDQSPVWVFQEEPGEDGPAERQAGLVLNLSEGGLQVLTGSTAAPTADRYEIRLGAAPEVAFGIARRIWTRPSETQGHVSGFAYEQVNAATTALRSRFNALSTDPAAPLPCTLIALWQPAAPPVD